MKISILGKTCPNTKPKTCPLSFNWADNPDIQRLLDVVAEIIANEYIEVAKRNKDTSQIASGASRPRNDGGVDARFRGHDNKGG